MTDPRSIRSYLLSTNVQLGATYKVSQASTNAYANAYKVAAGFINAQPDEVYMKSYIFLEPHFGGMEISDTPQD